MKLKDCPFCGSEPELNFGHVRDESIAYVIRTMNHRAEDDRTAAKMAVYHWNMRTEDSDER